MCLLFVSLLLTGNAFSQDVPVSGELNKKIASADLLSDLDFILARISDKQFNRTPFNFIPENDFQKEVKTIKDYLAKHDSLTRLDFLLSAGPLVASLKDDHASFKVGGSKWMQNTLKGGLTQEKFFIPMSAILYDGQAYVVASDTIPLKSQIISINDVPVMDVLGKTLKCVDYSIYSCIDRKLVTFFDFGKYAFELYTMFHFNNEITVKYIPYGQTKEEVVVMPLYRYMDKTALAKAKIIPIKMEKAPSLTFRDDIAILRIPSFQLGRNMGEALKQYLGLFDKYFKEIDAKKSKKLLIDLSNNGGGSEYPGYILLNYLTDKKLKVTYNSDDTTPAELFNQSIRKEIGDSVANQYQFSLFKGDVYLLTSELTFSAAARFGDVFKTNSLGKIIGRETRGFRTHYGEAKWYDLEKTGLGLQLSSKFLVSASGDMQPHGVTPDMEIKYKNIDDACDRFGNDYLLTEAVKYISAAN